MNQNFVERRMLMVKIASIGAAIGLVPACSTIAPEAPARFVTFESFKSTHVAARKVVVWLPENYDASRERYAVLYMHDGQNLFDPATATRGETWGVVKHLTDLRRAASVRHTIIVGIFNSPLRQREYLPAAPINALPPALRAIASDGPPLSEEYLRFMVTELKPFIDANFRTKPDRANTVVMGASMGGLISLYALARYPDVYGAAGCISTHWPLTTNAALLHPQVDARVGEIAQSFRDWLRTALPPAGVHRLYFDHGTINLDRLYAPHQDKIDALVRDKGYREGVDTLTRVTAGADHNEPAWRARLAVPLTFLLR
jgi:predicted alpha/beta superfamily hydrolase